jgi:hypothetical protein
MHLALGTILERFGGGPAGTRVLVLGLDNVRSLAMAVR